MPSSRELERECYEFTKMVSLYSMPHMQLPAPKAKAKSGPPEVKNFSLMFFSPIDYLYGTYWQKVRETPENLSPPAPEGGWILEN
jgi:hypothetical protein